MNIRDYSPNDREGIEKCIIDLQNFEHSLENDRLPGYEIYKKYLKYLLSSITTHRGRIFVAEESSHIIGFISFWIENEPQSIISPLKEWVMISDMIVLPKWRKKGIGRKMVERAIDFAKNNGLNTVKINAISRNQLAIDAYRAMGFKEYETTFKLLV